MSIWLRTQVAGRPSSRSTGPPGWADSRPGPYRPAPHLLDEIRPQRQEPLPQIGCLVVLPGSPVLGTQCHPGGELFLQRDDSIPPPVNPIKHVFQMIHTRPPALESREPRNLAHDRLKESTLFHRRITRNGPAEGDPHEPGSALSRIPDPHRHKRHRNTVADHPHKPRPGGTHDLGVVGPLGNTTIPSPSRRSSITTLRKRRLCRGRFRFSGMPPREVISQLERGFRNNSCLAT